jgi:hypothetical protein
VSSFLCGDSSSSSSSSSFTSQYSSCIFLHQLRMFGILMTSLSCLDWIFDMFVYGLPININVSQPYLWIFPSSTQSQVNMMDGGFESWMMHVPVLKVLLVIVFSSWHCRREEA